MDGTEAGGQGQRFEQLLVPHLDAAYNLARYLTRDATAAQDVVQDAFVRAFRSFAGYRGGDARAWLLAIVRNCSFDWLRSGRVAQVAADVDPDALADVELQTPEHCALRNDEIATVRATIQRLPEPFRETLVLRELEELSYRQIAAVTGVPLGTVMSRLARARRLLLEELEQNR